MVRKFLLLAYALIASFTLSICAANLPAAVLLSPATVIGTDLGVFDSTTPLVNMINQSGLDKLFTSGVTDFDTYFATGDPPFGQGNFVNNWQSNFSFNLPLMGYVDFDLGAVYSIDQLAIWNRSLKDIKILVSDTSINTLQEVASFILPNHLNFPFSYSPTLLDLGAAYNAQYLRIEIDSVHLFSPSDDFGYAIIGEVVAAALPSPVELDGDYNADGSVDAADYVVWRAKLGTDFDMPNDTTPGSVDPEDYDEWRAHFGDTASGLGMGAVVPEPTAGLIALFSLGLPTFLRRRKTDDTVAVGSN